jgi:hypothetical protein
VLLVLDLPQILLPAWAFNALISGLVCAATWHGLTILSLLWKSLRASKE